jgi:uncharacterized protein YceK
MKERSIGFRRCADILLMLLFAIGLTGCASIEPLPFAFSPPQVAHPGAPALTLSQTEDHRNGKDDMDKVLDLPKCFDTVITKELGESGMFSKVELKTSSTNEADYVLRCTLNKLEWEVPNYDRMVGTTFVLSIFTGGIGGVAYASTQTDVIGRAKMRFIVSRKDQSDILLDREYCGTVTERKAKLSCDFPSTYREVAAMAFRQVFDQFKTDMGRIVSK